MQALEEKMRRGINIPIRDESKDEDKVEENVKVEVVLNPEEERLLGPYPRLEKYLSLRFPQFWEILTRGVDQLDQ